MSVDRTALTTTQFGSIMVGKEQIIEFPNGLVGFEHERRFALLNHSEYQPFAHLQSMDDSELVFVITDPKLFFPHYKVRIDHHEIAELSVRDVSRVATWVIVTVSDDVAAISANLQGPLLINRENNRGKQVVLARSPYTTRQYLMDGLRKQGFLETRKASQAVPA